VEGATAAERDDAEPSDPRAVAVVVALAAGIPYASSLSYGFALDDTFAVVGHRGVHGPLSAMDLVLRDFWGRSFMDTIGSWRPVTTATYWIDWHVGAGRPWVFHATNVALYAALLVVCERFLTRFFGAALSARARCTAVGVFGLLAIHADVVPSIVGRAEILAGLFALLAILLPLRREGPMRLVEALVAAVASLLAMGSKESALPIALLAPVLAFRWHANRGTARGRGVFVLFALHAALLAGVVAFRLLRMPWMAPGPERATENPLIAVDVPARLLGAGAVFVHYLVHLVCPWRLAPDYSYAALDVLHETVLGALGIAVALGAAATVGARWRRAPGLTDATLALGASYVVVSHVFLPAVAVMADRLFFFPSFWVVVIATLALKPAAAHAPRAAGLLVVAFAVAQSIVAARDAAPWHDDTTLLTQAVDAQPSVARSRRNLAQALAEAGRPQEAAWQLVASMAILARYPGPVPRSEFRSLDLLPPSSRIDALMEHIGACGLRSRLTEARAAFGRWGMPDAQAQVDVWLVQKGANQADAHQDAHQGQGVTTPSFPHICPEGR